MEGIKAEFIGDILNNDKLSFEEIADAINKYNEAEAKAIKNITEVENFKQKFEEIKVIQA
jgi:hypothetical protein